MSTLQPLHKPVKTQIIQQTRSTQRYVAPPPRTEACGDGANEVKRTLKASWLTCVLLQHGEWAKKLGEKFGNAAVFGAGATAGSDLVNSIFK